MLMVSKKTFAILMVLTIPAIIAAQSAINSWDLLGHVNSLGKEIEITDNRRSIR